MSDMSSATLADIRASFLGYFERNDHSVTRSGPLVPLSDPTLLFTNSGMVQFKNIFTGQESSASPRVATAQKCVRAGGKHNDLDNVGHTARHHTFFEMLGNFSFGDYFKEQAIHYAWEFLTKELAIPRDRLVATVYAEDDEAFGLWQKIAGLDEARIIRIATADNFWSMGETGPCGPCSEIFFDHGEDIAGGPPGSPDEDGDRFIEIWNLVFMQYEQQADGTRNDLPRPSIDTGMGLERIGAVLQGKHDNYDTDLMAHLIEASAEVSQNAAAGAHMVSHRVIADHLRASAFLIADGVLPSNEGRGYVLRRIMRRAMRHAHLLGTDAPLLYRLVPALKTQMAAAYPELERADALIVETLRHEEERFRETLSRGLGLLDDELAAMQGKVLSGDVAFRLYDTFGFPLDLTQDALRERGLSVDMEGFDAAMERQRAEARANWVGSGEQAAEAVWFDLRNQHGATEFVGYQAEQAEGVVQALVRDGAVVEQAQAGEEVAVLLNQTPFYAESGGQVGDTGALESDGGCVVEVVDTQKHLGDLHVLVGRVQAGILAVGETVHQRVLSGRRDAVRANHSATHLLHEALRRVLGAHVTQKGSLVNEEGLRFDFSHPKPLTVDEQAEIEGLVNGVIRQNDAVETRVMTPDEAVGAGALALFGEKYGDEVRVLFMGESEGKPYSVELCGGTHVRRLGDIGLFKLVSEGAVASGVRRVEARTGAGALRHIESQSAILHDAMGALNVSADGLVARIDKLLGERKQFERDLREAKRALALGGGALDGGGSLGGGADDAPRDVNGVQYLGRCIEGLAARELRGLVDDGKARIGSGVVAFVGIDGSKAAIAVGVTADLVERFDAVSLVRLGSAALGGKGGGGRADFAQAGGSDVTAGAAALSAISAALEGDVSA